MRRRDRELVGPFSRSASSCWVPAAGCMHTHRRTHALSIDSRRACSLSGAALSSLPCQMLQYHIQDLHCLELDSDASQHDGQLILEIRLYDITATTHLSPAFAAPRAAAAPTSLAHCPGNRRRCRSGTPARNPAGMPVTMQHSSLLRLVWPTVKLDCGHSSLTIDATWRPHMLHVACALRIEHASGAAEDEYVIFRQSHRPCVHFDCIKKSTHSN